MGLTTHLDITNPGNRWCAGLFGILEIIGKRSRHFDPIINTMFNVYLRFENVEFIRDFVR